MLILKRVVRLGTIIFVKQGRKKRRRKRRTHALCLFQKPILSLVALMAR
jgi:hypothetical protein